MGPTSTTQTATWRKENSVGEVVPLFPIAILVPSGTGIAMMEARPTLAGAE